MRHRIHAAAWAFFQAQPPGYRKLTIHRVLAAKTTATRAKRLALLIDASAQGRRLATATQMEPAKEDL
ncbi:MAG TPA: YdeI/OmpD-associated family protein [Vicinamibacteria bacterium]|nr:YdeI/OmpD-associated family protein [Vicinamibacteria bacterium]